MKQKLFIISSLVFLGLIFGIYQCFQAFKMENVSAVTVGVHNPGHTWSEMECSLDTLCLDTTNKRVGIGTNTPTSTLDVVGSVKIAGSLYLNGLLVAPVPPTCGASNNASLPSIPTTNLCYSGIASSVAGSGPWTWTCSDQATSLSVNCKALYIINGTASNLFTGSYNMNVDISGSVITFSTPTATVHNGAWVATNHKFSKADKITVTLEYLKANGYDANLKKALSLRINSDSAGGHTTGSGGNGYCFPTTTYSQIWNMPASNSSYISTTININGLTGKYQVDGGAWTDIPSWSTISSTYNLEFANYDYSNINYPAYFRNIVIGFQ